MKTKMLVGFGLILILLLGLIGCEGVSGPRGEDGDPGDPGESWSAQPPENRFFAMAVSNGYVTDHNGASKLYLAFDGEHSNAGDTVVSVRLAEGQVPSIDGVDEGESGWGDMATTVDMERVAGYDNFITSATLRSAWDEKYVYFQVKWTEVDMPDEGMPAAMSDTPRFWWANTDIEENDDVLARSSSWRLDPGESDWLLFFFQVDEVEFFDHDGCYPTCHVGGAETTFHRTSNPRERIDFWAWSAAQDRMVGFAEDGYIDADNVEILSTTWDHGIPPWRNNFQTVRFEISEEIDSFVTFPRYQNINDPNYNGSYLLWDFELATLDILAPWQAFSIVPYYILSIPSGSAADVAAAGEFDDATKTWTVELKRARHTGSGDDTQF